MYGLAKTRVLRQGLGVVSSRLGIASACARSPEVKGRCGPQCFAEHGDKGTRRIIARVQRSMRDLGAFRQKSNSLHEAQLLPPFPQRHAGLLLKDSLQRALAGAC